MNKGLYQGSWQSIEVDYDRGEVRLSRRSTQSPVPKLLAQVPLAPDRSKRQVWAIASSSVQLGAAVRLDAPGAREARWDDGAWRPVFGSADSADLDAGTHLLTLREGVDGRHEAFEITLNGASDMLDIRWTRRLGGGIMSHLKMHGETLFVSAMDGSLYALDPRNGNALWRAITKGYCHSSPAFAEGLAIVGSADGSVHAFRIRDGKRAWTFATGGPVYASATVAKGVCAIASGDGIVYGLRASSGEEAWRYAFPEGDTAFSQSPAATDGERAFVGAWDKHLYCLDIASGRMLWRQLCTGSTFAFSPAIGGPAVSDGVVYVPANGNELYAFRCESGEPVWKATSPGDKFGYSSPCVSEGSIYIGCLGDLGEARCLDAVTGKERWAARTGAVIYDSSPAVGEGLVAIGSVNGTLHMLDASSGVRVSSYRLPPGHFLSSPLIEGRSIYAATLSDHVVRIDVSR
jgi:outer membrane protein assembly factor BamB